MAGLLEQRGDHAHRIRVQSDLRFVHDNHSRQLRLRLEQQCRQRHRTQRPVGKLMGPEFVVAVLLLPVEEDPLRIERPRGKAEIIEKGSAQTHRRNDSSVGVSIRHSEPIKKRRQVAAVTVQLPVVFDVSGRTYRGGQRRAMKMINANSVLETGVDRLLGSMGAFLLDDRTQAVDHRFIGSIPARRNLRMIPTINEVVGGLELQSLIEGPPTCFRRHRQAQLISLVTLEPKYKNAFGPPLRPTCPSIRPSRESRRVAKNDTRLDFPAPLAPMKTLNGPRAMSASRTDLNPEIRQRSIFSIRFVILFTLLIIPLSCHFIRRVRRFMAAMRTPARFFDRLDPAMRGVRLVPRDILGVVA